MLACTFSVFLFVSREVVERPDPFFLLPIYYYLPRSVLYYILIFYLETGRFLVVVPVDGSSLKWVYRSTFWNER